MGVGVERHRVAWDGHAHEARLHRWQLRVQLAVMLASALVVGGVADDVVVSLGGQPGVGYLVALGMAAVGVGLGSFTVGALYDLAARVLSPGDRYRGWVVATHTVWVISVFIAALTLARIVEAGRLEPVGGLVGFAGWCLLGVVVSLIARRYVRRGAFRPSPAPFTLPLPDAASREQCPHCGDLARIDARWCEWCGVHLPAGWQRRPR